MKNQRGYSLMEMLVVVAIIGVLMLVTIPNFINMRKSTIVKGGLRQFTNDLRASKVWSVGGGKVTGTVGVYHVNQRLDEDQMLGLGFQDVIGGGSYALFFE